MNPLVLILKQMRQRALSTWLTLVSVMLGVGLAVVVLVCQRQGAALFAQHDYGYDVLIGPKGSPLQLVLNTAYHLESSSGTIPYAFYERTQHGGDFFRYCRLAIPYGVGDSYMGHRIVGTTPALFGADEEGKPLPKENAEGKENVAAKGLEVRPGESYQLAAGRWFGGRKFEAVVGADAAARTGLHVGSTFHATHGMPGPNDVPDIHEEVWTVTGVLVPTHTANDRVLFIPLVSFYAITEHEAGLEAIHKVREGERADAATRGRGDAATMTAPADEKAYTLGDDGTIQLRLPRNEWEVSAILVKSRGAKPGMDLVDTINKGTEATAVQPAPVMGDFFRTILAPAAGVLLAIASLVTVVAGVSILVSIYNSISSRGQEIAILRALGATRVRIVSLICLEAGVIGLAGGVGGVLLGHGLAFGASVYLHRVLGQGMAWERVGAEELLYLGGVVVLALLAGLVPALKAYQVPVAAKLVE